MLEFWNLPTFLFLLVRCNYSSVFNLAWFWNCGVKLEISIGNFSLTTRTSSLTNMVLSNWRSELSNGSSELSNWSSEWFWVILTAENSSLTGSVAFWQNFCCQNDHGTVKMPWDPESKWPQICTKNSGNLRSAACLPNRCWFRGHVCQISVILRSGSPLRASPSAPSLRDKMTEIWQNGHRIHQLGDKMTRI